jgi:hypothetical protein
MSQQREQRRRDGELNTEEKKHIEQPGLKDQEQANVQPELEAPEPEGEDAELDDKGQEEEQDEETLDHNA